MHLRRPATTRRRSGWRSEWTGVGKAVHVAETDEQARSEADAYFIKNPSGAIARNADDMICGSPDTVARYDERLLQRPASG